MDFALRGDDPFPWLGDSEYFRALADDAVATNAKILGHIWGVDLGVGESLNLKCGIGREGGVFDCDGGAWCGMDDECRAGIHVDIFEVDIAVIVGHRPNPNPASIPPPDRPVLGDLSGESKKYPRRKSPFKSTNFERVFWEALA